MTAESNEQQHMSSTLSSGGNAQAVKIPTKFRSLKYQSEIDTFQFDFASYSEQDRTAYRWTFADINDRRNFLPRYALPPSRRKDDCRGWGLSFYISIEAAKQKIREIAIDKPLLVQKLGTHIAKGDLFERDGCSNNSREDGHFTLFEYVDVNLHQNFEVITTSYP